MELTFSSPPSSGNDALPLLFTTKVSPSIPIVASCAPAGERRKSQSFIARSEFSDFAKFLYDNSENILKKNKEILLSLISRCCELKACVVNQDEKEKGVRAILNFGHTIGHSIEKTTNYERFSNFPIWSFSMNCFVLKKKK